MMTIRECVRQSEASESERKDRDRVESACYCLVESAGEVKLDIRRWARRLGWLMRTIILLAGAAPFISRGNPQDSARIQLVTDAELNKLLTQFRNDFTMLALDAMNHGGTADACRKFIGEALVDFGEGKHFTTNQLVQARASAFKSVSSAVERFTLSTVAKEADLARKKVKPFMDFRAELIADKQVQVELLQSASEKERIELRKLFDELSAQVEISTPDSGSAPFTAYDRTLGDQIRERWHTLLEGHNYPAEGKVVLQFDLHYDGRVTDMTVAENTVGPIGGLICQKAVHDRAPFAMWPDEMQRVLGKHRSIRITFFYKQSQR